MSQPQNSANDILMGGGSPALKFDQIGATYTGTVVSEPTAVQQKDFRTQQPETWPDGSPKMQVLVQISTNLRDPQKPEDDGTRTLYVKGKELTNAVRAAVRASGANGIHTGGTLTIQYVGDGQAQAGFNPPKLYAAQYQAPAVSLTGVGQPAAPTSPGTNGQQQHLPQQPVAATVNAGPPCPPGVDPAMWIRLTPVQQQAVAAASAAQPAY